jgi:hypothetical protein
MARAKRAQRCLHLTSIAPKIEVGGGISWGCACDPVPVMVDQPPA